MECSGGAPQLEGKGEGPVSPCSGGTSNSKISLGFRDWKGLKSQQV